MEWIVEENLYPRLKWLIILRVIFVTLLLGSSVVFEVGQRRFYDSSLLNAIIIVTYLLSILYAIFLKNVKLHRISAYTQIAGDVAIETGLVYITGGIESWFSFTYLLTIIAGGILLYAKGGYLAASLSSIFYGGLIDLQFYSFLPLLPDVYLEEKEYLYNIFIHIIAFFLVAYLSSSLADRLRKKTAELKKKEEELRDKEKMAAIGELSQWIAHEIRNPLASLSGSIQMLREELLLDEKSRRLMEIALNEMDRLNTIITDFLNYAKPRSLSLQLCELNTIITEMITLLRNSRDYNEGIKIIEDLYQGKLELLLDPAQIKEVLWNLYMNAIQAMPDGGLLIVSSMKETDGFVELRFSDTGYGIKREDLKRIFYPFFTTKNNGSGLGLAIVHRIVEEHGGKIRVESKEGKGTTFKVYLPMKI
ncbi:MAG: ATP-binding protein [Nitrospirota bacterium]